MRITSPFAVTLTDSETETLTATIRRSTAPARGCAACPYIVLLAAAGQTNAEIAWTLGICDDTAGKWCCRFTQSGLAGLAYRHRSGRPPSFTAVQVAAVKARACESTGTPWAKRSCRWSSAELARAAVAQQILASVSASTVRRWLAEDALRARRQQCWTSPATLISKPKQAACWTCTSAVGRVAASAVTSM